MTACATLPNQHVHLTFGGGAGQVVSLWISGSTVTNAFVTLERPDQSVQNLGGFGPSGAFLGPVTLPEAGSYTLDIDPTDASVGCATYQLFTGTDVVTAIVPGGAGVQVCGTVPGQDMRLVFSGTAGQRVSLRVTGSSLANAFVTLVRPDQTAQDLGGFGPSGAFFDTLMLPAADTYVLNIDLSGDNTGCATLTLYNVPPDATAPITISGSDVTVCTTMPGQDIRLTFSGTSGQVVRLRVSGSTIANAFVSLLRGNQTVQNIGGFSTTAVTFATTPTLPATDTYTLFVNPSGMNTGCATFELTQV